MTTINTIIPAHAQFGDLFELKLKDPNYNPSKRSIIVRVARRSSGFDDRQIEYVLGRNETTHTLIRHQRESSRDKDQRLFSSGGNAPLCLPPEIDLNLEGVEVYIRMYVGGKEYTSLGTVQGVRPL